MNVFKKLLNIIFAVIFVCTCGRYTGDLNATIPEYKGLYTLFTKDGDTIPAVDTIGIGQSLLYSNWLENIYTYAPEDNAARRVITILWNKRLLEGPEGAQVFTETNNFATSGHDPIKSFKGKDIGMLIKYIRDYNNSNDQKYRPKFSVKCTGKKKILINNLFVSLENLKFNTNFIPEMAECILWAFFENKTNFGEQEFKECLNEIDPKLLKKLENKQTQENFYTIDKEIDATKDLTVIENIANKLTSEANNINNLVHYDAITSYLIQAKKNKSIPTKVLQANLQCAHPKTGIKSKEEFPTCFESSILDVLSILFYDPASKEYAPNILPESIRNGKTFKILIDQVFKALPEDKEFILSGNINKKIQAWINLVSNLQELKYKNNDGNRYDLNPSFENFVKTLNEFLDLGFTIIDTKDTLEINYNNNGTGNKITVQKDKLKSWQKLFNIISDKLSIEQRLIRFEIKNKEMENEIFRKINNKQNSSICVGPIKICVGYTELYIIISSGHAKVICPKRDKSNISSNNFIELKNKLIDTGIIINNKNLIPLLMLLPGMPITENNHITEQLLYYSFNFKDHNKKLDFLNKIFNQEPKTIENIYKNQDIQKLVSKLIELLPENDEYFIHPLSQYLDKEHDVLYWQNEIESKITKHIKKIKSDGKDPNNYLLTILPCLSINNEDPFLKNKLTKFFQNQTFFQNQSLKNNNKETPLHIASTFKKAIMVKILLNNPKIDVNAKNKYEETPLHSAFKKGHIDIFKILLDNPKTNHNVRNYSGDTLLQIALEAGKIDFFKMLLDYLKIDPNLKEIGRCEDSLLHRACEYKRGLSDIVKILLGNPNINPNIKNCYENTPLHMAITNNHLDIFKMLLDYSKTDPNIKNCNGNTPLHIALYNDKIDFFKMLIYNPKTDVTATNEDGDTAEDIAKKLNKKEILEILNQNKEIKINKLNL
ncbi:MAG: hypothetical protein UR12_C0012G0004 [candidate division TM6 bacterium GW2011_GWF2_30_66]|nr:MAG: hypothetical protein UR12_C0012G0004 [candidate division TM6 bacterium GW2011_GWF2_30_66]